MALHQQVRQRLFNIEQAMRDAEIWQPPPARAAFDSVEPFCIDMIEVQQWLQWILPPRMHALLDRDAPLPQRFALMPHFEEALPKAQALLQQLRQLDSPLGGGRWSSLLNCVTGINTWWRSINRPAGSPDFRRPVAGAVKRRGTQAGTAILAPSGEKALSDGSRAAIIWKVKGLSTMR